MKLTPIFKLLSDETRLRVILLISCEELCVCELCGILNEPQPKISKKILSKLRDLDLVSDQRKDKFVFYSIKDNNKLLNHTTQFILNNIDDYPNILEDQSRLKKTKNTISINVLLKRFETCHKERTYPYVFYKYFKLVKQSIPENGLVINSH